MSFQNDAQDKSRKINDYLLLINISDPSPQHAKIGDRISEVSTETGTYLWAIPNQVAFACRSRLLAWELRQHAAGGMPGVQECLVLELGRDWSAFERETKVAGWLTTHLGATLDRPRPSS